MNRCVVCGERIPEGYGQVCFACRNRYRQQEDLTQAENLNRLLQMLLAIERSAHEKTRSKLEKAVHDRERYAKRIRLLDDRNNVICAEYRAVKKERDLIASCYERMLNRHA